MKNLLLTITITLFLAGCSIFPQKFDNNEMEMFADFAAQTEELKFQCKSDDGIQVEDMLPKLRVLARKIELYSRFTPNNKEKTWPCNRS